MKAFQWKPLQPSHLTGLLLLDPLDIHFILLFALYGFFCLSLSNSVKGKMSQSKLL